MPYIISRELPSLKESNNHVRVQIYLCKLASKNITESINYLLAQLPIDHQLQEPILLG